MDENAFFIAQEDARSEIGRGGLSRIRKLQEHLGLDPASNGLLFRYAPSIITRSEAELFGLSAPRFAIRAYLSSAGDSFVNARRRVTFAEDIGGWDNRKPSSPSWTHAHVPGRRIREMSQAERDRLSQKPLITNNSCIADSVLAPPNHLTHKYFVLAVELGRVYGEGRDILGTPFVRHIEYNGGGMCAQAVCFMAAVLLHQYPQVFEGGSVHGVAEVTAIVAPNNANELLLRGLQWDEVVRYFTITGRQAFFQRPQLRRGSCAADHSFNVALRSYVLSTMPVIPVVNIQRMDPIYQRNTVNGSAQEQVDELNHAVVLVGCNRQTDGFLLNDPATLPFLEASAAELWNAGVVGQGKKAGHFIAVTPAPVQMPLEAWMDPRDSKRYSGLFGMAQLLQQYATIQPLHWPQIADKPGKYHPGEWRVGTLSTLLRSPTTPDPMRRALGDTARKLKIDESKWLWVQYWPISKYGLRSHTVWIWDAEASVRVRDWINPWTVSKDEYQAIHRVLIAVLKRRWGGYKVIHKSEPEQKVCSNIPPQQPEPPPDSSLELKASLISSYSAHGLRLVSRTWPTHSLPCELYAFMQKDVPDLVRACKGFGTALKPQMKAVQLMAALSRQPRAVDCAAKHVLSTLPQSARPVVAIASFLPEISSANLTTRTVGRNALLFLLGLAHSIRRLQARTRPVIIELVGGSLVEGIWPCFLEDERSNSEPEVAYVANRSRPEDCIQRIMQSLREACSAAQQLYGALDSPLAFELEPGPLYVLKDLRALSDFAAKIKDDALLSQVVGFNLDVAHWHLSGIDRVGGSLLEQEVWGRIVHSHISDHGRGHFGDSVVGDCGLGGASANPKERLRVFSQWVASIRRIASQVRPPNYPTFSGFVSVELEACVKPSEVLRAVDQCVDIVLQDALKARKTRRGIA